VVCLVSEGAEEKTMNQSKNAERTLGRALKKPESFTVIRGSPMLPQAPVLRKVDMTVAKEFHMSQVGGHAISAKSRRDLNDVDQLKNELSTNWRLNDAQEMSREAMFGDLSISTCLELQSSNGQRLPHAMEKRFLRARTRSLSAYETRRKVVPASFGISRSIVLQVERKHGKEVDRRILFNNVGSSRSRRESGALQQLFPLERSSETDSLDRGLLKMSLSPLKSNNRRGESMLSTAPESPVLLVPPIQNQNESPQKLHSSTAPDRDTNMTEASPRKLDSAASPSCDATVAGANKPPNPYLLSQTAGSENYRSTENVSQVQKDVVTRNDAKNVEASCVGPADGAQNAPGPSVEREKFHLPPPSASSSSESEDSSSDDDDSMEEKAPVESCAPRSQPLKPKIEDASQGIVAKQSANLGGPEVASEDHMRQGLPQPFRLADTLQEGSLRLPTQDSSSDEGSSDEESDEEQSSHAMPSKEIFVPPAEINVDHEMADNQDSNQSSEQEDAEGDASVSEESKGRRLLVLQEGRSSSAEEMETGASQILMDTPDDSSGRRPASLSKLFRDPASNIAATPLAAPRSSDASVELTDTPQVAATPLAPPGTSADSGTDLIDTPHCLDEGRMPPPPTRPMSSHDSQCTASKDDADEIVCSVCFDGASPEHNPIVLCDGPNNDMSCPLAVHKLCYSISGSLDDNDNWHCDVCSFRQQRRSAKRSVMQCLVCHKEDGPLKQMSGSSGLSWFHPHCQYALVDEDAFCQYCASKGATRCASDRCTEFTHPHCGLKLKKPWIVVAYASSSEASTSNLSSDEVIGCNIYCPLHRDQVCNSLARVGVIASAISANPRYVIVSSKLRDLNAGTASTGAAQRKRLRKKSKADGREDRPEGVAAAKSADESVESADVREQKRQRVLQRTKERASGMQHCRFLDLEVDIDSDDEGDNEEEDEARRLEEEEAFYNDFINDDSQLGYTQDDLDRLGLSENAESQAESGVVHRQVDNMRARMNQFDTPVFNRRMRKHARERENATPRSTSQYWEQPTPASEPSSQKGLGNMHFIRSVLEHHRNGGEADDIEEMYHTVAQEASPLEEGRPVREGNPAGRIEMSYAASDSEEWSDDEETQGNSRPAAMSRAASHVGPVGASSSAYQQQTAVAAAKPHVLTEEQRGRMEKNRQEALRRRQQHQAQNSRS